MTIPVGAREARGRGAAGRTTTSWYCRRRAWSSWSARRARASRRGRRALRARAGRVERPPPGGRRRERGGPRGERGRVRAARGHRARCDVGRGLTTVVDTLGLDAGSPGRVDRTGARAARRRPRASCSRRRRPSAGPATGRADKVVPERVLAAAGAAGEGPARRARPRVRRRARADGRAHARPRASRARRARSRPRRRPHRSGCDSGCRSRRSRGPAARPRLRARLRAIASAAEDAGFDSIWVMDHFRQIPMFGPAWHDMLESYTTLAYLAAVDRTDAARHARHRRDVPQRRAPREDRRDARRVERRSGDVRPRARLVRAPSTTRTAGRSRRRRRATRVLEDALQVLPMLWGKGTPAFDGRTILTCPTRPAIPRPLQAHVPILVGGNGERRTLRLAAQYADACNVIGDVEVVRRKVAALHAHCDDLGPRSRRGRGHAALDHARRPRRGRGRRAGRAAPAAAPGRRAVRGERQRRHRRRSDRPVPRAGRRGRADRDRQPPRPRAGRRPDPVERFAPVVAAFR